MELRRFLRLLQQKWLLIVVVMIVGGVIGYVVTPRHTLYRTTAELYVGQLEFAQNPNDLFLENQIGQVEASYAVMIPSPVIASKAIALTGVPRSTGTVVGETKAAVVLNTNLLTVSVTDPNPVVAEELANGISNAFVNQIKSYQPGASAGVGTVPTEPAYVYQTAGLPTVPLPWSATRHAVLGAVFGIVTAVLLILLLDYLDVTVKTAEELEKRLGVPVLGMVPLTSGPLDQVGLLEQVGR